MEAGEGAKSMNHGYQMITIGELARRTGVAHSALRFYEDRGLIQTERSPAGHRRFRRATIRRVAFIAFAQRIGLSLEEIRAELDQLPTERVPTGADWERLTGRWLQRVDRRIEELARLRSGLSECIGCGCLSVERCFLVNRGDAAGAAGPGPRFWMGDRRPEPPPADMEAAAAWMRAQRLPDHEHGPVDI